jgi:hypothetical protein
MKLPASKVGLILSGSYLLVSAYIIFTQGLFEDAAVVFGLGFPWGWASLFLGFFSPSVVFSYILFLAPILINAVIIYWIGLGIQKLFSK